ncbi:hypothetical protein ABAC460_00270 [Asticcacaulis sp. AC460]|uniref:hypothetical protein n=1 Tax=Asticcacaulis sp. AC460 TaxID=1282360 RepID=UPI0003C3CA2B|nr:hypothetical protein [Asticcacaulis sp. AC460]ESQ93536.1 hypothetical protein ABAC460_00270 [Asticcacaulis sp. AC460]
MRIAVIVGVLACLVACEKAPEPAPAPAVKVEVPAVPQAQADFVAAIEAADDQAGIDKFCGDFAGMAGFEGWVVTVRESQVSTLNRSVGITFNAGDGVKLEQVVQADNPLHGAVERLLIGDQVTISGAFTHGNGECSYSLDTFGIRLSQVG